MGLIDNSDMVKQIHDSLPGIADCLKDELILQPFTKDFALRFCWSSNALEGNTLTLEETISVIEYDEVYSGHTYREYQEAKNLYASVQKQMLPLAFRSISEDWLKQANGFIMRENETGEYRKKRVYIGTLAEAVYYPPEPDRLPELMKQYMEKWNYIYGENNINKTGVGKKSVATANSEISLNRIFELLAQEHIEFESIHPFLDGNGRTGRMLLSQRMVNQGLLPIAIEPSGDYRRAFRRYEKNGDLSPMVHVLCKGELAALSRVNCLKEKKD